jgi:hypothetical protein
MVGNVAGPIPTIFSETDMDNVLYTPWLDKGRLETKSSAEMLMAANLIWWANSPDQSTPFRLAARSRQKWIAIVSAIRFRFNAFRQICVLDGDEASDLQSRPGRKRIRHRVFEILRDNS